MDTGFSLLEPSARRQTPDFGSPDLRSLSSSNPPRFGSFRKAHSLQTSVKRPRLFSPALRLSNSRGAKAGERDHDSTCAASEVGRDCGSIDEPSPEVVMALNMRDGASMGCAFFTTSTGILSLSEDIPWADVDIAERFISHVQPTTLLVSARAPQHLLDYLEKHAAPSDRAPDFVLRTLPSSDFSPASAHDRILNLQLDRSPQPSALFSLAGRGDELQMSNSDPCVCNSAPQESRNVKLLRVGSLVNLESLVSVTCAGAVLSELHRRLSASSQAETDGFPPAHKVTSICTFALANYVHVNGETLRSLQIVHAESHPNSQTWGPDPDKAGVKESLSVYGLLQNLASTPQGRISLRQLLLRPTVELEAITKRHCMIATLLRPENSDKTKQASVCLRKVQNMRATFSQLHKGVSYPSSGYSFNNGVWVSLRRFAAHALKLRELVSTIREAHGVGDIHELVASMNQAVLVTVGDMIDRTIDFDQSESQRRTSVKAGVDAQLDELKRQYDGMGSFLTEVANQVNQKVPGWAARYIRSCVFLPQVGFLMVVELDPHTGDGKYEGEGVGDERWEKMFTVDDTACYKNRYMQELDEQYGDMYCEIGDREVEIIHGLATDVLGHEDDCIAASDACGNFDALLALALGADKYNWTAPQMTRSSVIHIEDGRHPLLELVVPCFVPNDCRLGGQVDSEEANKVLVLTGPNHSGKSVLLKQVAIIVYLAHVGSFVPAGRAVVGITDKILTRISTQESMCRTQSAFAIDLGQVARALRCVTQTSLVLIDEFGKGTNPDDGAGLLAAMLDYFVALGPCSPRLLVTTHFHELLGGCYLTKAENLQLAHMQVKLDREAQSDDQVTYFFKLVEGYCSSSFGGRCAALNGVPSSIVARAEAISCLLDGGEDLNSLGATLSSDEKKQLGLAENVARRFLQRDFEGIVDGPSATSPRLKEVLCEILEGGKTDVGW
ncbi:hypothetical protein XA68_13032 [Ophiocordyceps unilateralis]|uniref:DNA mismatch repair protein MSH5 n=1 Tax=Ophiocordyceps unilateralis TaxID=268505 RepID=A0A2A9PDG7_OPHUN|nr:hypothetical protein XA68_13032 [Ophiocordyceps unilateralis]